jgi:hypothetical protein
MEAEGEDAMRRRKICVIELEPEKPTPPPGPEFLENLQRAVLLSLLESGLLTGEQYGRCEEKLFGNRLKTDSVDRRGKKQ